MAKKLNEQKLIQYLYEMKEEMKNPLSQTDFSEGLASGHVKAYEHLIKNLENQISFLYDED